MTDRRPAASRGCQPALGAPDPLDVVDLLRENLALLADLVARYETARLGPPRTRQTIRSPDDLDRYLGPEMQDLAQEQLRVVSLTTRNQILAVSLVAQGTVNVLHARMADLFLDAVRLGAPSIILVHNHPAGDPTPSPEDVTFTDQAVKAGELLGIQVLDHLVLSRQGAVSLRKRGLGFPPAFPSNVRPQ